MKKRANLFILFLLIIFGILEVINIHLSNSISTNSIYASSLQTKVENLAEKNTLLKTEVLKYTSYDYISSKAATLGFVENKKSAISVSGPNSFAQK